MNKNKKKPHNNKKESEVFLENEINGIESEKNEIDEKISVEKVKITNEEGEKAIRKANR